MVVSVTVVLTVLVSRGAVIVVAGVKVVFAVALLVRVRATEKVGTGVIDFFPSNVVQT